METLNKSGDNAWVKEWVSCIISEKNSYHWRNFNFIEVVFPNVLWNFKEHGRGFATIQPKLKHAKVVIYVTSLNFFVDPIK